MLVIGEKINGTRKAVGKAVDAKDEAFIKNLAQAQVDAGADYLDINAGTKPDTEPQDLAWLVRVVQEITDTPLCLDSPNPKALEAAFAEVKSSPMINSISGEPDRLDAILPLAAKQNCPVIALALDENGIPKGVDGRMKVVRKIFDHTRKAGLGDDKIYVDPLIMTISTDQQAGLMALDTIRAVHAEYPECHFTAGLSNISFGMPGRSAVNQAFLVLALSAGLDSAIINPMDHQLRTALFAAQVILGRDRYCMAYNRAFRAGKIGPSPQA